MSSPITLSNYAIPFSDTASDIVVLPTGGYRLTSVSATGFTRRSCHISSVNIECADRAVVLQLDVAGIGMRNFYADLEEQRGDFYEHEDTDSGWVSIKRVAEGLYEIEFDVDVDSVSVGSGNIANLSLVIPPIQANGDTVRKIPVSFYVTGFDDDDVPFYNDVRMSITASSAMSGDYRDSYPYIGYVDNLASRIGEPAEIVLHGRNFVSGMNVYLTDGKDEYVVPSSDIVFGDDGTTAKFTLYPKMLSVDGDGNDACGVYDIHIGFDALNKDYGDLAIIRYKYDADNLEARERTPAKFTGVGDCFDVSDMSLVYDTTDRNGNGVPNPAAGTLGKTMYIKVFGDCSGYRYVPVRLKLNKNLSYRFGESYINGVQLEAGDIVWLSNQFNPDENGLWVVEVGAWRGLDDVHASSCPSNCYSKPHPGAVDGTVVIDLGAKVTDQVDYVCSDDVPYKCGSRTVCTYSVHPGDTLLLSNQKDGYNGIWKVTCGDWIFMGPPDANDGTKVGMSRRIITQNNINFCNCGETYHIDYYYLNPSCYMTHLRRNVRLMCTDASVVPNNEDHQVRISEYRVTVGIEDSLVGNRGRTPGDPVKDDCVRSDEDFSLKNGVGIREFVQDMPCCAIECLKSPEGVPMCDLPKFYSIRPDKSYGNSNDANGFTIKFWRHESNGWHLYAYIGSGTAMSGMDYYVYHLHVKGAATENLVDVNEHSWFTRNGGVIASGEVDVISPVCDDDGNEVHCESPYEEVVDSRTFINSFALTDDTWEFSYYDIDPDSPGVDRIYYSHNLDSDEKLFSQWRIKCTTSILAVRMWDPSGTEGANDERLTCEDMDDDVRNELAEGTPEQPGYIAGMRHVWGFGYYKTVMSKAEFCDEFNKYKPGVENDAVEVVGTDSVDPVTGQPEAITTDGSTAIQTDPSVAGSGTSGSGSGGQGIATKPIIDLPAGTADDPGRPWIPATRPDPNNPNGRETVRLPYPAGDHDVDCGFCGGTGYATCERCGGTGLEPGTDDEVCTRCDGHKGYECPVCHGAGGGAVSVSDNGVISVHTDNKSVVVDDNGALAVKVDGTTITMGPNGLEAHGESGYVKATMKLSNDDLVPNSYYLVPDSSTGENLSIGNNGFINLGQFKGADVSLVVSIDNTAEDNSGHAKYLSNIWLVPFEISVVSLSGSTVKSWTMIADTTKPYETFDIDYVFNSKSRFHLRYLEDAEHIGQVSFDLAAHSV